VESEQVFARVLQRMSLGTRMHGINCLIINTNIQETDTVTGLELEPQFEVSLTAAEAQKFVEYVYAGWSVLQSKVRSLELVIERGDREVLLKGDVLTYVVQKGRHSI
jgi:hypothetical protein